LSVLLMSVDVVLCSWERSEVVIRQCREYYGKGGLGMFSLVVVVGGGWGSELVSELLLCRIYIIFMSSIGLCISMYHVQFLCLETAYVKAFSCI
jgi:hypothetical protein